MTEHKFTDEEIIKAVECCLTVDVKGCGECPYRDENCINRIMTDARDLINRQKAEIERLTTLAELGRMRANDYRTMRDKAKIARAEAIKEFADRLCEGRVSNDPVVIAVNAELKMTEEKE